MNDRHLASTPSYPLPECLTCPICFETYDCPDEGGNQAQQQHIPVVTRCGHTFCRLCFNEFGNLSTTTPQCPICRSVFTLPLPNNFNFISLLKYWNVNMKGRMIIDPDRVMKGRTGAEEKKKLTTEQKILAHLEMLFPMAKEWELPLTKREIWLIIYLQVLLFFFVREYRQLWILINDMTLSPFVSLVSQLLFMFVYYLLPSISSTLNSLGAMFVTPLLICISCHSLLFHSQRMQYEVRAILQLCKRVFVGFGIVFQNLRNQFSRSVS
jgi:hypothetical protein